ncbi:NTP transferase domain-containing protein [Chiayiivirga flava]|uniref:Molybdopterin-guanine dinucleotide biosynthesis protein A n=1 Tax=Chiayiivirga flava TaxID=659595 RepID=A0A7W8G0N4_9GAMM|nr:NTP transferase domain-containing protein [Chiayiivirga flava]MBB5208524.1 molybdopterin-guanine dinucleotide biosynthesis protein A [Chiayiivirga flava]
MSVPGIAVGILAGGEGTRFGGVDKGWIERDGRAQIEHVLQAVAANSAALVDAGFPAIALVMVSANRNLERYAAALDGAGDASAVVPDRWPDYPGPMAGIASLLSRLDRSERLLTVPIDHADLPHDYALRMLSSGTSADDFVVASDGDGVQPMFALYPGALGAVFVAAFEAGERSVNRWQRVHMPRLCHFAGHRFGNLNAPTDLPPA